MRLIPKNSKLNMTVWKNFTITDVFFGFALFAVVCLMLLSNIPGKFYYAIAIAAITILLFMESEGNRLYREIFQIFRFIASVKKFSKPSAASKPTSRGNMDILIPYTGFLENGTIAFSGYYGRVLSIGSTEFRLLNEWMQNMRISQFAKIINSLGYKQCMQLVKLDRPIIFDDIAQKLYDKIKKEEGDEGNETKLEILRDRLNQIDSLNNFEKQYRPYFYLVFFDENAAALESVVHRIKSVIENEMKLECDLLDLKQTALFLKYCYNRNFDEREIDDLEPREYIDFVKPDSVVFKSRRFEIDGIKAFNCCVSDYPLSVTNAWGAGLFNIDNTKVVLSIHPVEKIKALKRVDRTVSELGTVSENINKASQVISNQTHIETMGALLSSLQNENELMFDCSLVITGYENDNNAVNFQKQLMQSISSEGFRTNSLLGRQLEGFITSNISSRRALKPFERGINSESLAAVFPFVFTSIIEEEGIALGHNNYPVILDFWKRNDKYTSSNILIFGKPGGGKSFFTKLLSTLLYSDNARMFILDPENEYASLTRALGGAIIDVGNATSGRLNPFHIYQIITETGKPAAPEVVYESHLRFLESFLSVVLPEINHDALEVINNLVVTCYERRKISRDTDCKDFPPEMFPTFDDLYDIINIELEEEGNPALKANLQRAQNYIAKFAKGGRYSNLWNGPSTLTSEETVTLFNFQGLLASKNTTVANGQMLLVMRYLEQQVINIQQYNKLHPNNIIHPIVALDEAYTFTDPKYPVALEFVYYWEKRIRKYFGSVVFITQNIKDLTSNPETLSRTTSIINNSQYSFIFPLAPGDITDLVEIYRNAGELNEVEQNEIAQNGRGSAFLISAPGERTSFEVVASDAIQKLFQDKPVDAEVA